MGLLLTYGLATRHACYAPATRPLRALYAPSTRPLRARYAPATRPLLAVDLHVWFSQDEEVFTQQVK